MCLKNSIQILMWEYINIPLNNRKIIFDFNANVSVPPYIYTLKNNNNKKDQGIYTK